MISSLKQITAVLLLSLVLSQLCTGRGEEPVGPAPDEGSAEEEARGDLVIEIDKTNWARMTIENPRVLVYFWAGWCGYCRQLTPEYYKAAAILRKEGNPVPFAMMGSSDLNKDLFDKFRITKFPTVLMVGRGIPSTVYRGDYVASSIAQFVRGSSGDALTHVSSMQDLEEFITKVAENAHYAENVKIVVGLELSEASSGSESAHMKTFRAAALARPSGDAYGPFALSQGNNELFKSLLIAHIQNEKEGGSSGFFLAIFSLDQKDPVGIERMLPESTADDILRYVDSFHLPVILKYHDSNLKRIQWFAHGVQILVFSPSTGDHRPYEQQWPEWLSKHSAADPSPGMSPWDKVGDLFLGVVSQMADRYRGRILFIHVPESEYHIYQLFHVNRKEGFSPEIVIVDMRNSGQMARYQLGSYKKYQLVVEEALTEISEWLAAEKEMVQALSIERKGTKVDTLRNSLALFISEFSKGNISPTIVSESVEAHVVETSAVRRIVGNNFVTEIANISTDLYMVAFMAPWCGHSKALEPVLDKLARYFTANNNDISAPIIKIGKIDATKNEIVYPGVKVFGYPTIYFFKNLRRETLSACVLDGEVNPATDCLASATTATSTEPLVKVIEYDGQRSFKELKKAVKALSSAQKR